MKDNKKKKEERERKNETIQKKVTEEKARQKCGSYEKERKSINKKILLLTESQQIRK